MTRWRIRPVVAGRWSLAAVLVFAAIFLRNHQIDDVAAHQPIDVRGVVGQPLSGRNITATVHSVRVAEQVVSAKYGETYRPVSAGLFVLVDYSVEAITEDGYRASSLAIGDREFDPIYVDGSWIDTQTVAGVSMSGTEVFEIPQSLASEQAEFRVTGNRDPRLDSRLVFDVNLAEVPRLPTATFSLSGLTP